MPDTRNPLDPDHNEVVSISEDAIAAHLASPAEHATLAAHSVKPILGTARALRVHQVFDNHFSPHLPVSANITTQGGTLVLMFSGTGRVASANPGSKYVLGAYIDIDNEHV